jgi:amidase
MIEISLLDATAEADLVRTGEVSATELVEAAIDRIEALNPTLKAVISMTYDEALTHAAGGLSGAPCRGALPAEGSGDRARRDSIHRGLAILGRQRLDRDQRTCHPTGAGRADHFGTDQHL